MQWRRADFCLLGSITTMMSTPTLKTRPRMMEKHKDIKALQVQVKFVQFKRLASLQQILIFCCAHQYTPATSITTRPQDAGTPKATQPQLRTEFGYCIHDNIYFLPCSEPPTEAAPNHYFSIEDQFVYCPFARDFGPFNLGVVLRFCELMDEKKEEFPARKIILHCPMEPEKCTNVAFLLGSFLVSFPCDRI